MAIKPILSLQLGMHWFPERQGGLDRVYYELSRALPHCSVEVCGLVVGSQKVATDSQGAIRAFARPDVALLARWSGIRKASASIIAKRKPDLVVSHFALYTLPIIRRLKVPLVVHFQGPWADEGSFEGNTGLRYSVKRWVESLVYRKAAHAIVLSQAFADILAMRYNYPRERIHVIPGGIDAPRFAVDATRSQARLRLDWPMDRPIVIAVRRLVSRMGLENLIAAVAIVKRHIPDILVLIAGKGVLQPQLKAQINELGLRDNVSLLGFIPDDDLPYVYRAANLSVVPSVALEGFGLIAAESLAAGTPCLVSPVGGLPEVVGALSKNLILTSPATADIARALQTALTGELVLPDALSCSTYAAENFDWRIIAAKVGQVYRQALA